MITRYRSSLAPGALSGAIQRWRDGGGQAGQPADALDVAEDPGVGFVPESYDPATREIDVVLSTGADVLRFDWWTGETFTERLSLADGHAILDRLNAGAPWLRVHNARDLDAVLGVIKPGTVRIEGEDLRIEGGANGAKMLGRVRLSDTPGDAEVVRKIATGLIRGVSIGYDTEAEQVDKPSAANATEIRTAIRWTAFEGSSVPVGADAGAGTRQRAELAPPPVPPPATPANREDPTMTTATNPAPVADESTIRAQAVAEERARGAAIRQAGKVCGTDAATIEAMITEGVPVEAARAKLLEQAAARDAATRVAPNLRGVEIVAAEEDKRARGVELALLHRAFPADYKLDGPDADEARHWRGMTLFEIGDEFARSRGLHLRGEDRLTRAGAMLRGSGADSVADFPNVLANVPRRILRESYAAAPVTFKEWATQATLSDFRKKYAVQLGAAPNLEKLPESGEFRRGSIVDGGESYGLDTFGKIIAITRKALINDDLGAFTRIPRRMADAAARLENAIVWHLLLDNGNMTDGKAIFHADHRNLLAEGGGFAGDSGEGKAQLKAMRSALARQVDLDGATRLNLAMRFLLVPDALYDDAISLLKTAFNPTTAGANVAEIYRNLTIVTDPIMDDTSEGEWYGVADPAQTDGIEYAYLDGQTGPFLDSEIEFGTDGLSLKVRHDFGAGCIDHRFAVKNPGPGA